MEKIPVSAALDRIATWGRTYFDKEEGTLYSNFTCGSFEVDFQGRELQVQFSAVPDTFVMPVPGKELPPREDWPFVAVFLDGSETPHSKIRVRDGETITLFSAEGQEHHRIRIVKLNENFRTCVGIRGFVLDGQLLPFEKEQRDIIEFIGDSITCGFGNDTADITHEYESAEEDGWMTHGAIAARQLGLEPRFICVSGISIENVTPMPGFYCMRQLYPYADRVIQEKMAKQRGQENPTLQKFDFQASPARYVVLNLGTNDANQIYFREDKEQAELDFEKNYENFVKEIRELNGPDTVIICALGCMDYYLYDKIRDIVEKIKEKTGDNRLFTLKYNKMMNVGPDAGGCLHPSIHRHKLMADDLVKKIQTLQEKGL